MYNNEIQLFDNEELNAHIRVVDIDGEPWFVAKDLCDFLGTRTTNLAAIVRAQDKDTYTICTPGGNQKMAIISEPGMYKLVFRSRKPEADAFTDWVARDVLPTIRKTGSYGKTNQLPTLREALEGWLEEVKAHEQTKLERDEAIRTKAWIADRQTASALSKAGVLQRKFNMLQKKYGELSDAYNELKESNSMHSFRQYKKLAKEHKELTAKYDRLRKEQTEFQHVHNVDPSVLSILNGINELVANAEK